MKCQRVSDLANVDQTLRFGDRIHNPRSVTWNPNRATQNGNGITNNTLFVPQGSAAAGHRCQTTTVYQ